MIISLDFPDEAYAGLVLVGTEEEVGGIRVPCKTTSTHGAVNVVSAVPGDIVLRSQRTGTVKVRLFTHPEGDEWLLDLGPYQLGLADSVILEQLTLKPDL